MSVKAGAGIRAPRHLGCGLGGCRRHPPAFPPPDDLLVFRGQQGGFLRAANFRERVFTKKADGRQAVRPRSRPVYGFFALN